MRVIWRNYQNSLTTCEIVKCLQQVLLRVQILFSLIIVFIENRKLNKMFQS